MGTPGAYPVVSVKRFGRETIQGREALIQNAVAMCTIDNVVRERVKGGGKGKGIELIGSLGKVEKEDSLEL